MLILILEMDVKLLFYGGKIENAYMSRFLKRTHAAVLSAVQLSIHIEGLGDGNIAIPHHNFLGDTSACVLW